MDKEDRDLAIFIGVMSVIFIIITLIWWTK